MQDIMKKLKWSKFSRAKKTQRVNLIKLKTNNVYESAQLLNY